MVFSAAPLKQAQQTDREEYGSEPAAHDGFPSASAANWLTRILIVYFGLRLLYLALTISPFVPPDEVTHAGICRIFSKVLLLPENTPATYEYGLVTNIPWLYYWCMGKLLHLNVFGISDLIFLRLLNIPLAFLTVCFARRTLTLFTDNRMTELLLLTVMTNTAMFSLLSASVSYDNLLNALAAMAIYYLLAFFRYRSARLLLASILCQLAGALTKVTFLPLMLVLGVLLLTHVIRYPAAYAAVVRSGLEQRRFSLWAVYVLIGVLLNLQLYGGNYYRYGSLNPSMATILTPEAAMNYRLEARGTIFNLYKEEKISYMDALIMAGEIRHPGDKADTFYLLMNYENLKRNPQLWLGPLRYVQVWIENMAATVFGIKGHLIMVKEGFQLIPIYLFMTAALLGMIFRWNREGLPWLSACLMVTMSFYAGYLFFELNYPVYRHYGAPGVTLYGRYLFPVMVPFSVLFCHNLLGLFRNWRLQMALALVTALLFIVYDHPWFLMHATPEWYQWLPQ